MQSRSVKRLVIGRRKAFLLPLAAMTVASGQASGADKPPYKFGALMPTTGPESANGLDFVKTFEMALKEINDAGGVDGHPLEMIVLDTQAKPELAIAGAQKLIDVDQVPLIVTAWSSVVKALGPLMNRARVLQLNMGANSPDIANLGEFTYSTFPLSEVDITALANYAYVKLGKRRAAVLYINNDSGIGGARLFRDVFTKAGGEIVAFEAYDPKATDFTGLLLKLRVANPDMVHLQSLSEITAVMAQMRQLGMTQQVTTYSAGYNPKLLAQLGPAAEGMIVTSLAPTSANNANVAKLIELWKPSGRTPNGLPYLQYAWDTTIVISQIYRWLDQKSMPLTGEDCIKALLAIREFDLPMTGKLVIGDDHRVKKPVYLYVVKNNKFDLLDTVA